MNQTKYQVFISSTYSDLKDERRKVLDVLLMADCIPSGMEAFVATDSEQFEVIKKVIDLCDYYVLILGKRYGSVNQNTGISFTEMEYDYAKSKNIPVLVFAIDESVELIPEKTETTPDKAARLKLFRNKAMNNTLATIWKTTDELMGALAISIMKAKNEIARPGWQRGTEYDEASLRREIMEVEKEKQKIQLSLDKANREIESLTSQSDIAFDGFQIVIDYQWSTGKGRDYRRHDNKKSVDMKDLFAIIATEMLDVSISESRIEEIIIKQLFGSSNSYYLSDEQLVKRIVNQFKELGLIKSTWSDKKGVLFWGLTNKGEKVKNDMILVRAAKPPEAKLNSK